ncbi:hypothetical protein OPV22_011467 [Ensete ventricosum]|uniref:TRF2/HOY1 PH-like domain-containing protein n=1 Tax=Ensete ventricosum TaxID=4639 RepID=A0AAV8Q5G0_ENSVE|nr:hypothetical protein OPV22_011467 [Ensete ventricosum]
MCTVPLVFHRIGAFGVRAQSTLLGDFLRSKGVRGGGNRFLVRRLWNLFRYGLAGGRPSALMSGFEDSLGDEHGPPNKRSRHVKPPDQQAFYYNAHTEAGPFGLHLTKSPSVVDVVQKILPPSDAVSTYEIFCIILRIGNWEFVSRNEIDLVAKCYFAKNKFIWEVIGYRLKSKIEFYWSNIIVIKAKCCKSGHGSLDIVLLIRSLFFRETDPQSKKQTMWQAAPDLQMVNQEYIDKIMEDTSFEMD